MNTLPIEVSKHIISFIGHHQSLHNLSQTNKYHRDLLMIQCGCCKNLRCHYRVIECLPKSGVLACEGLLEIVQKRGFESALRRNYKAVCESCVFECGNCEDVVFRNRMGNPYNLKIYCFEDEFLTSSFLASASS